MAIDLPRLMDEDELQDNVLNEFISSMNRGFQRPKLKLIADKFNVPVGTIYNIVADYQFNPKTSRLRHYTEEALQFFVDTFRNPNEKTKDRTNAAQIFLNFMLDKENTADKGHFNLNISLAPDDKVGENVEIRTNEIEASFTEVEDD